MKHSAVLILLFLCTALNGAAQTADLPQIRQKWRGEAVLCRWQAVHHVGGRTSQLERIECRVYEAHLGQDLFDASEYGDRDGQLGIG